MDPPFPNREKEKYPAGSNPHPSASTVPRPLEGLQDSWPPPFLTKTYDMVDDAGTDQVVSWSKMNNSFVVWDPHSFAMDLLPKHFKHNNFSSFVRQLNTYLWKKMLEQANHHSSFLIGQKGETAFTIYSDQTSYRCLDQVVPTIGTECGDLVGINGFRKVDPDKWEFAHEGFLRGQKHLLMTIKRRRPPTHPSHQQQASEACLEVGRYGLDGEVDRLKRDKSLLMAEVIKLRQDQQNSKVRIQAMAEKLHGLEQKQQHMMTFLARAMQNPSFLQQLAEQQERRKELQEAISKKRKRYINIVPANVDVGTSQQQIQDPESIFNLEGNEQYGYGISELEDLALGVQGLDEIKDDNPNEEQQLEVQEGELNDEFWQQMFNEMISDEPGTTDLDFKE